ncbi:DNA helicase [Tanacetum coccineum]
MLHQPLTNVSYAWKESRSESSRSNVGCGQQFQLPANSVEPFDYAGRGCMRSSVGCSSIDDNQSFGYFGFVFRTGACVVYCGEGSYSKVDGSSYRYSGNKVPVILDFQNSEIRPMSAQCVSGNTPVLEGTTSMAASNASRPIIDDIGCFLLQNPSCTHNTGPSGTKLIGSKRARTGENACSIKMHAIELPVLGHAVLPSNVGSNSIRVEGVSAEKVSDSIPVLDDRNFLAGSNGSQPLDVDVGFPSGTEIVGIKRRQTGKNVGSRKRRAMNVGSNNNRVEGVSSCYVDIGDYDCSCEYCGAKFWYGERLKGYSRDRKLYIYDTENEVANRMRHFGGDGYGGLDQNIVQRLISFLDEHNELVRLFRTARDKCAGQSVPDFKVRLYSVTGYREYDLPTSQTLGGIVFQSGQHTETDYDVIIESRGGSPQRINKLHPSYMSLQFPLLFVFGQPGFHTEIQQQGVDEEKRVSMNMFYMYQLHERINSYWLLFRGGRLLQQYVVGVYCCIEQNRMGYYRTPQNDIRKDYMSVEDFYRFLKDSRLFGAVTGLLYTIEFQKRGLPHCHTLLWVDDKDKIRCEKDIDQYISVELPDPEDDPQGYRVVSEMMVHGPCGLVDPSAPYGYARYRRRESGVYTTRRGVDLDNTYTVPTIGTDRIVAQITRPVGESPLPSDRVQIQGVGHLKTSEWSTRSYTLLSMPHVKLWGLLGDDKEWDTALVEACFSSTPSELRNLFVQLFIFCEVSNPRGLWTKHWRRMSDVLDYDHI